MAPSSDRYGARVIWIVVHTAEGATNVDNLQAYFNSGVAASSHAGADDHKLEEGWVSYDRAAWTLRSGNRVSDNLELCGFASWSRAEWFEHRGMLDHAATWIRRRCLARGIPIRKLSASDVDFDRAGVIGHVDYTRGTGDGTHWDPGPNFPWDYVMERAAGQPDEPKQDNEEDDGMVRFLKGDATALDAQGVPYGDRVFKVEYAHDGGAIAVRTRVPHGNDPGYRAWLASGGKVHQVPQDVLDAIPYKAG